MTCLVLSEDGSQYPRSHPDVASHCPGSRRVRDFRVYCIQRVQRNQSRAEILEFKVLLSTHAHPRGASVGGSNEPSFLR